jgi:hypothetical protein
MTATNIELSVGTVISATASQPATEDQTGYEALSWTVVGEVTDIGESGGSATITTFTPVASGVVNKRKGSIDYGTMALAIAKDAADTGQILLKAGFDGAQRDTVHSFLVAEPNSGDEAYFMGSISSFTTVRGDANAVIAHNCNKLAIPDTVTVHI